MSLGLADYRERVDGLLAQHRLAASKVKDYRRELVAAEDHLAYVEEAQQIAQVIAQTVQQQAHDKIASVVTRCLVAVFDDPYEFQILFERKRGRTEARLVFVREGFQVDPLEASGGGVVDVAAFALRLACLMLTRPKRRRTIILDEPFRFVFVEYLPRIKTLLEVLAKEMGVQFVIVTHANGLQSGAVVTL